MPTCSKLEDVEFEAVGNSVKLAPPHSVASIERLSAIVFPLSARERNMAMYSAYFDESTGNKSPIFVVAGFLSRDVLWSQFEKEWKEVLGKFEVKAFHAQHFSKHKGEFLEAVS
jgi:hypothetical protein